MSTKADRAEVVRSGQFVIDKRSATYAFCRILSLLYLLHRPHRPTILVKTARGLLDTNQTHQRLALHNLTQVMTYCCPVKMNLLVKIKC